MTGCRSHAGFTLIELLIATALLSLIAAALLTVTQPVQALVIVQPEAADVQQRLRVAAGTLQRAAEVAGAGLTATGSTGSLHHYFAAVLPYRIGERSADPPRGVFFRPDAVTLISVPRDAIPARIVEVSTASAPVLVRVEANCTSALGVCGFAAGTPIAVFDRRGRFWLGTVQRVDDRLLEIDSSAIDSDVDVAAGALVTAVDVAVYEMELDRTTAVPRLTRYDGRASDLPVVDHIVGLAFSYFGDPRPPGLIPGTEAADGSLLATYGPSPPPVDIDRPADSWLAGENCVFSVADGVQVPRLATLAPGEALVPLTSGMLSDGPWCPDAASAQRFDADLLRVRRIDVLVRVQASMPRFRGANPSLFANPGPARAAVWLVPDQEVRLSVTPRNLRAIGVR